MTHLLIWGNAYVQIIRDRSGQVISLYPLLPDKLSVHRDESGKLYYKYKRQSEEKPNFNEMGDAIVKADDVLLVPGR
ncbi:phage portal protein, partial [Streptococcus suis]